MTASTDQIQAAMNRVLEGKAGNDDFALLDSSGNRQFLVDNGGDAFNDWTWKEENDPPTHDFRPHDGEEVPEGGVREPDPE